MSKNKYIFCSGDKNTHSVQNFNCLPIQFVRYITLTDGQTEGIQEATKIYQAVNKDLEHNSVELSVRKPIK